MRYAWVVALAVGVAACDTDGTEQVEDFEIEPAQETMTPEPTGATTGAAIQVATLPDGGEYLTDADGRALYLLEDEDDADACVDACAAVWPPFTTQAGESPMASGVARPDLIATVERPDGSLQVTYAGHPLYYYAQDSEPGMTSGQDVHDEWGEWYLVDPSGDEQEGDSPDAGAQNDDRTGGGY